MMWENDNQELIQVLPSFAVIAGCPTFSPTAEMLGYREVEATIEPINEYQYSGPWERQEDGSWVKRAINKDLSEIKSQAISLVLAQQQAIINAGYQSEALGIRVRLANEDLTMYATGYDSAVAAGVNQTIIWDYDRQMHNITVDQYKQLSTELHEYVVMGYRKSTTEKIMSIMACQSIDELVALMVTLNPQEESHEPV